MTDTDLHLIFSEAEKILNHQLFYRVATDQLIIESTVTRLNLSPRQYLKKYQDFFPIDS